MDVEYIDRPMEWDTVIDRLAEGIDTGIERLAEEMLAGMNERLTYRLRICLPT